MWETHRMVDAKDKSKLGYRILLGGFVLLLGGSMLLYLVPQSPVSGEISSDTLAKIGDESVSVQDVRQQLNQIEEKFRKLVTDGISVGPAELQDEFRYKNEKVKLDYALIKPEDLEAKILPDEAEVHAAYEKNKSKYQVPERRVVRYALVDVNQMRQSLQVSDDMLKQQYQANIQQYQVPNRVHVQHILFMTVGKTTDAEVEEVKKKAEDVLKQVKKGGKFEDLAKKYSEDPGSKDKGGDLSWITQGQTVPEFEKTAFSLGPGQVSELVKTNTASTSSKCWKKRPLTPSRSRK